MSGVMTPKLLSALDFLCSFFTKKFPFLLFLGLCVMPGYSAPDLTGYGGPFTDGKSYPFSIKENAANWGGELSLQFAIANFGDVTAGFSRVSIYLSEDLVIGDEGDVEIHDFLLGEIPASTGIKFDDEKIRLPESNPLAGEPTSFHIGMVIDADEEVDESNERNNSNRGDGLDRDDSPILVGDPLPSLQEAYLKASNNDPADELNFWDNFGQAVAISGDTAVVGAWRESGSSGGVNGDQTENFFDDKTGAAYVFVRRNGNWIQEAYLKARHPDASDEFGRSVAISGDTIVVGAIGESGGNSGINGDETDNSNGRSGAAYVFVRNGSNWTQQAYLKASNPGSDDRFGDAVAIDGDLIVVGSAQEDSNASGVDGDGGDDELSNSGAAYLFERSGVAWSPAGFLKASNPDEADNFGYSVAISGNTVVVGAILEQSAASVVDGGQSDNSLERAGAAYVFVKTGSGWKQQAYLKPSNIHGRQLFGSSIAVKGDLVVVGGRDDLLAGSVCLFERTGTNWHEVQMLAASNGEDMDYFGSTVAFDGQTIVVGAHGEDSGSTGTDGDQGNNNSNRSGAVYAFEKQRGQWIQRHYLKASNTGDLHAYGYSVGVSNGTMIAGAPSESGISSGVNGSQSQSSGVQSSGAAYIFQLEGDEPAEVSVSKTSLTSGVFTLEFTGDVGVDGWRAMGSTDLAGFNIDLTASMTIVEVSAGFYRAKIDVSGYPDRLFIKVEK